MGQTGTPIYIFMIQLKKKGGEKKGKKKEKKQPQIHKGGDGPFVHQQALRALRW